MELLFQALCLSTFKLSPTQNTCLFTTGNDDKARLSVCSLLASTLPACQTNLARTRHSADPCRSVAAYSPENQPIYRVNLSDGLPRATRGYPPCLGDMGQPASGRPLRSTPKRTIDQQKKKQKESPKKLHYASAHSEALPNTPVSKAFSTAWLLNWTGRAGRLVGWFRLPNYQMSNIKMFIVNQNLLKGFSQKKGSCIYFRSLSKANLKISCKKICCEILDLI